MSPQKVWDRGKTLSPMGGVKINENIFNPRFSSEGTALLSLLLPFDAQVLMSSVVFHGSYGNGSNTTLGKGEG